MPAAIEFPISPCFPSLCIPLEVQATSYFAASDRISSFRSIDNASSGTIATPLPLILLFIVMSILSNENCPCVRPFLPLIISYICSNFKYLAKYLFDFIPVVNQKGCLSLCNSDSWEVLVLQAHISTSLHKITERLS